ncbi:hypothetical protein IQ07DRAFT_668990 [Pyrenochaeta sp. DS3sAY3a]|nr:hypothetical protein IQ07DRAFT_668990 [Pyrenochaeta sp. DS3sAY3a]
MAEQPQSTVCLDIAIDHRLRPLFRPLNTACDSSQGDHVRLVRRLGHDLLRDGKKIRSDEIKMAVYLAMPSTTGGICFVLQQPANNHPYHLGVDTVVESSPTLRALLLEAWNTVSCNSSKPSILDRLPFIRSQDGIDSNLQHLVQERSFAMIKAKRPKVVVCMWKRKSHDEDVGSMRTVEGIGLGRTFASCHQELEPGFHTQLVNAFHPSYAVNYNPHESCFRQLLLLEMTQACGLYADRWHNKCWMDDMREQCKRRASALRQEKITMTSVADAYRRKLVFIQNFIEQTVKMITTREASAHFLYQHLMGFKITGHINDASLCARHLHTYALAIHPDDVDDGDARAIELIASTTLNAVEKLVKNIAGKRQLTWNTQASLLCFKQHGKEKWLENEKLRRILQEFVSKMNDSFILVKMKEIYEYRLLEWSEVLLSLAEQLETLLFDLDEDMWDLDPRQHNACPEASADGHYHAMCQSVLLAASFPKHSVSRRKELRSNQTHAKSPRWKDLNLHCETIAFQNDVHILW